MSAIPLLALFTFGLVLGLGIGLFLAPRSAAAAEPVKPHQEPANAASPMIDEDKSREVLRQLQSLTNRVAEDVRLHASKVDAANKEIKALPDDGNLIDSFKSIVEHVISANDQMQGKLQAAENKLEEQARMIQVFVNEARTDGLTELANRRAFDREMEKRVGDFLADGTPFALMMCDIDHFKRFNDTFGHAAGDAVLRGVAKILSRSVREDDFPARYGGEEFAVIMPATPADQASQLADKACSQVEASTFRFESMDLQVTVSGGVAVSVAGDTIKSIIDRADAGLYESKKAGRNCVHLSEDGSFERIKRKSNVDRRVYRVIPPGTASQEKDASQDSVAEVDQAAATPAAV